MVIFFVGAVGDLIIDTACGAKAVVVVNKQKMGNIEKINLLLSNLIFPSEFLCKIIIIV